MTGQELLDLMAFVEPKYIEEAEVFLIRKKVVWKKWVASAACLCLLLGGALVMREQFLFLLPDEITQPQQTTAPTSTESIVTTPCIDASMFESVEKLVLAKRAGELEAWLPGVKSFYLPEKEFPGYRLSSISVVNMHIVLSYVPDADYFEGHTFGNIYFSQTLEKWEDTLGIIEEQFNIERTTEGYVYAEKWNEIFFETDGYRFSITVPDSMNDYEMLKTYCNVKAISFADYEIPKEYYE